jgi:predicted GNAT superfamily acetyltransferase
MTPGYTIRPFVTAEEYRACVGLQEETWGVGFSERVSPAILKVSQILGGVASGAYDAAGRLVGFVFGMTGVRDGEVVHWSDMLAVRPEARDSGLGRRLKEYQREEVMARGVRKMFWTFDPLQSRNAHLNIAKLGAVVREYRENMYGDTDSPLHRGIGTDRCVALWLLGSERVRARLAHDGPAADRTDVTVRLREGRVGRGPFGAGKTASGGALLLQDTPIALGAETGGVHPRPSAPVLSLTAPAVAVSVPAEIGALMKDDLSLAVAWREATRAVFLHYLSAGWEVREFVRGDPTSTYLVCAPPLVS